MPEIIGILNLSSLKTIEAVDEETGIDLEEHISDQISKELYKDLKGIEWNTL